jgi:DNA repair photolyase
MRDSIVFKFIVPLEEQIIYKKYSYPITLTSQFYFCGMPLRLDSYRGCASGCLYCFANSRRGNYSVDRQYTDPNLIRKWFKQALTQPKAQINVVLECLQRKMPLHFGGMSDPLLIPESFNYVTLEILKILDEYRYPTLISTKSDIISNEEFAKIILGKKHFALQISFSTFDDNIASAIEPKTPLPSRRLAGVKAAINHSNWVSCRLQPYFPSLNIDSVVNLISAAGFKHLTIEHFKLPFDSKINLKSLDRAFDIKLSDFFPKGKRIKRGREFEMPFEIRTANIRAFIDSAKKYNILLGIGDNGFQHLSTSHCCCGIDSLPEFGNWYKYNVTEVVRRAISDNERIKYELIADEWTPNSNIAWVINSKTRLKDTYNSVKNHLMMQWTNNKDFSPSMFYNILAKRSGDTYDYFFNDEFRGQQ